MKNKIYRVEILIEGESEYVGIFRNLDWEKIGMKFSVFWSLLDNCVGTLPEPKGNYFGKFWFTQRGWSHFQKKIKNLAQAIIDCNPNYIQDIRVLVMNKECIKHNSITYEDAFQISIWGSLENTQIYTQPLLSTI